MWKWFEDVVRGNRDHFGIHNTGNLVIAEVKMLAGDEEGEKYYLKSKLL